MKNEFRSKLLVLAAIAAAFLSVACGRPDSGNAGVANADQANSPRPTIVAANIEDSEGGYKLISGETLKLSVSAPNAREVEFYYQPITASDRALKLKTVTEQTGGNFSHEMKAPPDFNGNVWARVIYPDGKVQLTDRLLLAANDGMENARAPQPDAANSNTNSSSQSDDPNGDASERSDKSTGGRVSRAQLQPGDADIRVSVNVPAFQLTLWQNGKEVATYPVGVGLKAYPIPIGERTADKIILNPDWVPPDSEWVRASDSVEPYGRIPADDPLNPLGKIKIPLGNAYLLHEAQSPSDIGNLVSHGCVRVMRDDIFELSKLISRALGLDVDESVFEQARNSSERRVIDFKNPIEVDINYDTMVVENGRLHIYPDVYDRKTNTVENLRAELREYAIDDTNIDGPTLEKMIGQVTDDEKYVVALADIRAGKITENGKTEPVVPEQAEKNGKNSNKNSSGT